MATNALKTSVDPLSTILQNTPEDVALDKKIQESLEAKSGLEVATKKNEAEEAAMKAKGEQDVQKEYARKVEEDPLRAEKLGLIEKQKDTTFVPTKETVNDLTALFAMTNLLGFMIGGKSKNNAQAAMSAMNGMLEGHQKGLEDRYKKEKEIYEENAKALDRTINALDKQLTENIQLYATDRDAGLAALRTTLAEHNAKFLQDALEKYGPAYMYEQYMNTKKVNDQLKEKKAKLYEHEEALQHQREMERQGQERLGYEQQRLELERQKAAGLRKTDRYGFGDILATASNEAAASMRNIMSLPVESTSGIFGGKQTNSLFTAPVDAFANKITNESTQRYNTEASKLSYNLAQLMKGGRQVGVGETAVMDNVIKIKEGDSIETAATKLAEARQMAERAIEVRIKSPNTPPELKEVYKENLETIKSVIPFTVDDINNFVKEKDGSTTFAESLSKKYEPKSEEHPKDIEDIMKKYGG
jgi:hypothetical protein